MIRNKESEQKDYSDYFEIKNASVFGFINETSKNV